ncbi:VOC family protein [Spongiimicrobium sp. 3-5]|uniref:VOC family protein n=1 Tax=Spongiimicrobium sp. 3-5 TaxID=3332596 RepID=UPI003980DAF6
MKKIKEILLLLVCLPTLLIGQTTSESAFERNTISIGLVASDLEESLKFYTEIVGLVETGGFSIDEAFGKSSGLTGGTPFDVKILKLEDDPSASELKIVTFNNEKNMSEQHIQERNGMRYMTIFVKSLEPVIARITENNIPMLGDTPIKIGDGRGFVLVQDPDGVFVELIGH